MGYGKAGKRILYALVTVAIAWCAFAFGFLASLHLRNAPSSEARQGYLRQAANASPAVRTGVLAALRSFQDGYIKRDPKQLDAFMAHTFPENGDILLLGTDGEEWVRGYSAVARFIKTDWQRWGDFRFAVDDSIVWSSGDVAWVASVGSLHTEHADRPMRFSAILTRSGEGWVFQQLHFQWDDRDPRPSELLHPSLYGRLAGVMLRYIRGAQ